MAPPFRYSHYEQGNVLVQNLTDWSGETEGMDHVENEWLSRASQPHITAAITEFGAGMELGAEVQDHLAREWGENAQRADIGKIAFVSDGIEARAVSANLDVSPEIRSFESLSEAIGWAWE